MRTLQFIFHTQDNSGSSPVVTKSGHRARSNIDIVRYVQDRTRLNLAAIVLIEATVESRYFRYNPFFTRFYPFSSEFFISLLCSSRRRILGRDNPCTQSSTCGFAGRIAQKPRYENSNAYCRGRLSRRWQNTLLVQSTVRHNPHEAKHNFFFFFSEFWWLIGAGRKQNEALLSTPNPFNSKPCHAQHARDARWWRRNPSGGTLWSAMEERLGGCCF